MTIIETVKQKVDKILRSNKKFYLIQDFGIECIFNNCSTHAGKCFRKYIRSKGFVMVSANTIRLSEITDIKVRGNKTVIISKANYELYKNTSVLLAKANKKALLEALTVEDVQYIKEVIDAKVEFLLRSLMTNEFHQQLRTDLFYRTGKKRIPDINRIALVTNKEALSRLN